MKTTVPSSPPNIGSVKFQEAIESWGKYFADSYAAKKPIDSLLSTLIEKLKSLEKKDWADWLYELKFVDEKTSSQIHEMVSKPPPESNDLGAMDCYRDAKNWALFLLVIDAVGNLENKAPTAVDDLTNWLPPRRGKHPAFVRHCWDGYFLFCRQVAIKCLGTDRSLWTMEIPDVCVNGQWLKIKPEDLEDTTSKLWRDIKGETKGFIEPRFAWHEYKMPALWQGTDKANEVNRTVAQSDNKNSETDVSTTKYSYLYFNHRLDKIIKKQKNAPIDDKKDLECSDPKAQAITTRKSAFSATKIRVAASLAFRDMGIATAKCLEFPDPQANKAQTKATSKSFSLPGLLWAMGLDGGVRLQNGKLKDIKKEFCKPSDSTQMLIKQPFYSAAEVLKAVQGEVMSKDSNKSARYAGSLRDVTTENISFVTLDKKNWAIEWDPEEEISSIKINDLPYLRLNDWEDARFYESAGGKTMPVVFHVVDEGKNEHTWTWGTSEDWGLEDDGVTQFEIRLLHDESASAFCDRESPLSLDEAKVLDMSKHDNFKDYFVLYLSFSLVT